jgi:hypothetical protein
MRFHAPARPASQQGADQIGVRQAARQQATHARPLVKRRCGDCDRQPPRCVHNVVRLGSATAASCNRGRPDASPRVARMSKPARAPMMSRLETHDAVGATAIPRRDVAGRLPFADLRTFLPPKDIKACVPERAAVHPIPHFELSFMTGYVRLTWLRYLS